MNTCPRYIPNFFTFPSHLHLTLNKIFPIFFTTFFFVQLNAFLYAFAIWTVLLYFTDLNQFTPNYDIKI
jgi:hypothetical protein